MSRGQRELFGDDRPAYQGRGSAIVQVKVWLLEERAESLRCATSEPGPGRAWHVIHLPISQISHNSKVKNPPCEHWECTISIPRWLARKNNLEEL